MWVAWSGQDTVMSQPIWYIIDSARNSKIQITGKSFWVQCHTFTTHFSPSLTWALKSQRTVSLGLSLTPNMLFLYQHHLVPNTTWAALCPLTFDPMSVELVPMPQAEGSRLSWLQMPATWSQVTYDSNQLTKSESFYDPTSMHNTSIEPVTKLRKIFTHCSQINI